MRICQKHWDRLRAALDTRGIGHLGAKSGEQAIANIITDLEGRGAENEYDPLMACNNMIFTEGLKRCGLDLMRPGETPDDHKCPICESLRQYEEWWIDGPADAALQDCKERGLIDP